MVTIQFADDNTSGTGVASFVTGSIADNNFAAYAADISNLEYTVTSNTASAVSGTVEFTLTNFTTNKYFAGTVTFKGNYTVGSSASDKITITSGTFTGKDPKGVATTATAASLGYQVGASNIDLSGTYNGKITVPLAGRPDDHGRDPGQSLQRQAAPQRHLPVHRVRLRPEQPRRLRRVHALVALRVRSTPRPRSRSRASPFRRA